MLYHDAFYRFVRLEDPQGLATALEAVCTQVGVLGTILLAGEGINGMLCGTSEGLGQVRGALEADPRFAGLFYKRTGCSAQVFKRLKVRVKPEIVPLGLEGVDATLHRGTDLSPEQWRALLRRDDVIVIDNRNTFEYELGHFKGAVNPGVEHFRDFAAYLERELPTWEAEGKTVAMYCTGGIRCEKTSAWLAAQGHTVLQLEGGVLHYFQTLSDADADYEGDLFVFDARELLDTRGQETVGADPSSVSDPSRLYSSARK